MRRGWTFLPAEAGLQEPVATTRLNVAATARMLFIGSENRLVALASVIELQSQAADIEVVAGRGCDSLSPCVTQRLLLRAALASDCPLSFKIDNVAPRLSSLGRLLL